MSGNQQTEPTQSAVEELEITKYTTTYVRVQARAVEQRGIFDVRNATK